MAISKEALRQAIQDKREEIDLVKVIDRPFDYEENGNYVFVGVRRVGKSYMMYQRVKQLQRRGYDWSRLLFVNFEDERLSELTFEDLNLLLELHYEAYGKIEKPFLFFDEIQNILHWDKFVRRLADAGYHIYVSGSNAKMLSEDVATTLGGRFFIIDVYPYSFGEFLTANQVQLGDNWQYSTLEKGRVMNLFNTFLRYGALPEIPHFVAKRAMLSSIYQKIYLGDVCRRNHIRNPRVLELLVKKLAENVKHPSSYNRLHNIVKSTGSPATVTTISEYITHLISSWLIVPIENQFAPFTEKESIKKYYFIDNGILNLFLSDADSSLLENIVAITLCRKYGRDKVHYVKDGWEVDFYLSEQKQAIQVAYSLSDQDTKQREIHALVSLYAKHPDTRLFVITMEEKDTLLIDNVAIEVVPIYEWLLN